MAKTNDGELPPMKSVSVELRRTSQEPTEDQALWSAIRRTTETIGFDAFQEHIDELFTGEGEGSYLKRLAKALEARGLDAEQRIRNLPFPRVDAYNLLKVSTETFLEQYCGVADTKVNVDGATSSYAEERARGVSDPSRLSELWNVYRGQNADPDKADSDELKNVIPYLDLIRRKLKDEPVIDEKSSILAYGILQDKLTNPPMIELIWSYWMEEGGLAQTFNAILYRFQNRRKASGPDRLANMEIDPLRPLNNLLWGFVQDEQHRLTVARRAYEYDHHYGFSIEGRAVPKLRTADSRPKFLEAFHNLLQRCAVFYEQDDDTTRIADGFPILNALKETHILLTQGGHNQYGDLPWTARQEMLMMQWVLARPEMREFLNGRIMVAYAEPWMDPVDAMKKLQGWTDTSITHFRDLAIFGERVLLSARFGAWSKVTMPQQAANWARYFRPEIQGYIHAYRAVTGVNLDAVEIEHKQLALTKPSKLLAERESRMVRR